MKGVIGVYEISKTGKGVVKISGDRRYHKGMIVGRLENYLLTRNRDALTSHAARYHLFKETPDGLEKLNLTLKENREIKARILN